MAVEWRWEGSRAKSVGRGDRPYSPALGCPEELALGKSQTEVRGRERMPQVSWSD